MTNPLREAIEAVRQESIRAWGDYRLMHLVCDEAEKALAELERLRELLQRFLASDGYGDRTTALVALMEEAKKELGE